VETPDFQQRRTKICRRHRALDDVVVFWRASAMLVGQQHHTSIMKYGGPCAPSQQLCIIMLDVQMSCGAVKSCRNGQMRHGNTLSLQED
jgi:hypothetical protein